MAFRIAFFGLLAAVVLSTQATAADLPPIRTSEKNVVPECATPGRMMAFLRSRNDKFDPRFDKIAVEYMRRGEELGVRWDYAFFQMVIETGYLTFRRDNGKPSAVKPSQNNFAGLGATGRGVSGESFPDLETGVLAHLQHVLMYAGEQIDNPVAERTRKVIEWGILDAWRKKIKGPMTFTDLAQKWASSSEYVHALETHAERFYASFCHKPDPNPELLAEARPAAQEKTRQTASITADSDRPKPAVSGVELARQAIEEGKAEGNQTRSGLGASYLARAAEAKPEAKLESSSDANDAVAHVGSGKQAIGVGRPDRKDAPATVQTASAGGALVKPMTTPQAQKCRVWTASYGGQKAVLIRAQAGGAVNYTVLDVNEGIEKREAEAYIAAYAKGGAVAGEFQSQSQALDKAFELCPEG